MTSTRLIGADRVTVTGDRLVVVARVAMDGWEPSRYRPALIRFDGRTWRVTGKSAGASGAMRYELAAWQPADGEVTGRTIEYTPDYVALRDHSRSLVQRRGYVVIVLRWLSPLVGFLPARTKGRFEALYGLDPVASTFHSVFLEFLIAIGSFVLASIGQMVRGLAGVSAGWNAWLFFAIGLVVVIDGSMRYSRILREERPPVGFFEWIRR